MVSAVAVSPGEPDGSEVARLVDVINEMRDEQERARRRYLSHGIVDQAVGVLIARTGGSSAAALGQLSDLSERTGRPLLEIAADLTGETLPLDARDPADEARLRPQVLALDRAEDDADLARLLVGEALGWSGAAAAALAVIQPDEVLELAGSTGFPARAISQWSRIPPALDCLLTRAVRTRSPVWVDASSQAVPPLLGESDLTVAATPRHGTRVAVPLVSGQRLIGAVEIAWPTGVRFDPDQRREIAAVAQAVTPSLSRSGRPVAAVDDVPRLPTSVAWQALVDALSQAAVMLTPISGPSAAVAGFRIAAANGEAIELLSLGGQPVGRRMIEVAPWLAGSFEQLRSAYLSGVPALIEVDDDQDSAATSPSDSGQLDSGQLDPGQPDPGQPRRAHRLRATRVDDHLMLTATGIDDADEDPDRLANLQRLARVGSWEWDLRSRTARWSPEALMILGSRLSSRHTPLEPMPYTVHPDDSRASRRFIAVITAEGRPSEAEFRVLQENGTTRHIRLAGTPVLDRAGRPASAFGIVQDVSDQRRTETALEIARVQLTAQRTRADAERQLAVLLQNIVLPDEPVRPPSESGVSVVARYLPASANAGVGGDWYGVFPLADSKVLLTIGDVAGHGLPAASAMAQLYHTAHGLALTGAGPAQILHWLNALTHDQLEFTIASSCCALYDPAERHLSWANAGHPSPVIVSADRCEQLAAPIGAILGATAESVYQEAETTIEPGTHLLLYTDGLVERRSVSDAETIEHFLAVAAGPEADLEAYADRILAGAHSDTDDDRCLIAVRFS